MQEGVCVRPPTHPHTHTELPRQSTQPLDEGLCRGLSRVPAEAREYIHACPSSTVDLLHEDLLAYYYVYIIDLIESRYYQ